MKKILTKSNFAVILLLASLLFSGNLFAHFGSKGPYGGSVSCAIVKDTTVYLGTFSGGVYISTNSRFVNWTPRPVGLKSGKISALAHTGSYLFAATADSGVYSFTGFAGSDRYWVKKNNGLANLKITSLVAIDSITLLAGTDGGGVYKTTNKGNTWGAVNNSLTYLDISGMVKAGNRIFSTSLSSGIWASDNNGTSWFDFNDANTRNIGGTLAISYNATTDQILVANNNGLFRATVGATTIPVYTSVGTGLSAGTTIRSISNNGTTWYLATDKGVYTSPANAIAWTSLNTGLKTNDVTAVVPFAFKNTLVCGTRGEGIFKAPVTFTTWTATNNGFNNIRTYSMTSSGANLVVAATEKGVFISKDLAASYQRANTGLTDSLHVNDIMFANSRLFAATLNAGVFMSADSGKTWMSINSGLPVMNITKLFYSNGVKYAIAANNTIYSSPLTGTSWTSEQNNLPAGVIPSSLAFYGTNMLLGTRGSGIYMKPVSGTSWTQSNAGLTNQDVTSMTALGTKIFAGTNGAGVFVSDAATINWTTTANTSISHTTLMGLNGKFIQAMASNAGYVFVSYRGGLLASSDNGTTWIEGGNQFNLPSYADVNKISFTNARVFVTTPDNALYSNALSELPAVSTGLHDEMLQSQLQVFPNPSTGNFLVSLENAKEYELKVTDLTGNVILTKVAKGKAHLNLENAAKGLYLLKVSGQNGTASRKLIIE